MKLIQCDICKEIKGTSVSHYDLMFRKVENCQFLDVNTMKHLCQLCFDKMFTGDKPND